MQNLKASVATTMTSRQIMRLATNIYDRQATNR